MKDISQREYATIEGTNAGDLVQVDSDFTCIKPWLVTKVQADPDGKLFIPCDDGNHYLDGQIDDDSYVGIYHVELAP
jgi:hypothetical protein